MCLFKKHWTTSIFISHECCTKWFSLFIHRTNIHFIFAQDIFITLCIRNQELTERDDFIFRFYLFLVYCVQRRKEYGFGWCVIGFIYMRKWKWQIEILFISTRLRDSIRTKMIWIWKCVSICILVDRWVALSNRHNVQTFRISHV